MQMSFILRQTNITLRSLVKHREVLKVLPKLHTKFQPMIVLVRLLGIKQRNCLKQFMTLKFLQIRKC
ncbi:Uncharacterised protein [Yersinia enterocolitica]|nr:Uncharacterised protein [Yersinia enterocolitica]